MLAASTQTSVGVLLVVSPSWSSAVVYAFINLRQAQPEIGSEIELAPNRKPYVDDEELEGRKLDRTLSLGLLGLFIVGIGLPLYWLRSRVARATARGDLHRKFVDRGAEMFATTEKGGFNCAFHGVEGASAAPRRTRSPTPRAGSSSRRLAGPGAQHRAAPLQPRRGALHPRVRPPVLADARVGHQGRRSAHRAEAPEPDRLPGLDPARRRQEAQKQVTEQSADEDDGQDEPPASPLAPRGRSRRCPARSWRRSTRSTSTPTSCPPSTQRGRSPVQHGLRRRLRRRRVLVRPLPHQGVVLRREGGRRAAPSALRSPTCAAVPRQLARLASRSTSSASAPTRARYGQNGQGTGRMPGFCITPEAKLNPENGEVGMTPRTPARRDGRDAHPGAGPGHRRSTNGAFPNDGAALASITWHPGFRGLLTGGGRRRRPLCGSVVLILATNSGPASASCWRSPGFRLDLRHGHHLVHVRHRLQGPGAHLEGGRRGGGSPPGGRSPRRPDASRCRRSCPTRSSCATPSPALLEAYPARQQRPDPRRPGDRRRGTWPRSSTRSAPEASSRPQQVHR